MIWIRKIYYNFPEAAFKQCALIRNSESTLSFPVLYGPFDSIPAWTHFSI